MLKCGPGPRVRKPWHVHSGKEKNLFRHAIASAMKDGGYYDMIQLHMHLHSNQLAHAPVAFGPWHAAFTLLFENYLRDLQPRFNCLTIPTWSVENDFAKMESWMSQNKTNVWLNRVSPVIDDICGDTKKHPATDYTWHRYFFDKKEVAGKCYSGYPCNALCSDERIQDCRPCVLRNNMAKTVLPVQAGLGHLAQLVHNSPNYEAFMTSFQSGLHDKLHSSIGGHMTSFASPVDPIFYVVHATVEQWTFHYRECHVGDRRMTTREKIEGKYSFVHRKSTLVSTDEIYMYLPQVNSKGNSSLVHVKDHVRLGPYFRAVGTFYYQYSDAKSMTRGYEVTYARAPHIDKYVLNQPKYCPVYTSSRRKNHNIIPGRRRLGAKRDLLAQPAIEEARYWTWYADIQDKVQRALESTTFVDTLASRVAADVPAQLECLVYLDYHGKNSLTTRGPEFLQSMHQRGTTHPCLEFVATHPQNPLRHLSYGLRSESISIPLEYLHSRQNQLAAQTYIPA